MKKHVWQFTTSAGTGYSIAENPPNRGNATLLHPWPGEVMPGTRVKNFSGEIQWFGRVVACYRTLRNTVRYVVEVEPQGLQMIFSGMQIIPVPEGHVFGVHLYFPTLPPNTQYIIQS